MTAWWFFATYPSEKWWTEWVTVGMMTFHSQLFLESHSNFHCSSHHQGAFIASVHGSAWIYCDKSWDTQWIGRENPQRKSIDFIIQFCVTPPGDFYWFINLSNCAKNPTVRLAYPKTQKSPTKIHTLVKKIQSNLVKPHIFADDFYRMVPPSDVCWFINPMNTSSLYLP